eukprot:1156479-Pelagomonas_calceolata.AAC.3
MCSLTSKAKQAGSGSFRKGFCGCKLRHFPATSHTCIQTHEACEHEGGKAGGGRTDITFSQPHTCRAAEKLPGAKGADMLGPASGLGAITEPST